MKIKIHTGVSLNPYNFLSSVEHESTFVVHFSKTTWLPKFFKISSFVFQRKNKIFMLVTKQLLKPFVTNILQNSIFHVPKTRKYFEECWQNKYSVKTTRLIVSVYQRRYIEKSMPKIPRSSTISVRVLKCVCVHTLTVNIAHNPLCFDEGYGSELQTRIKCVKKCQTCCMMSYEKRLSTFILLKSVYQCYLLYFIRNSNVNLETSIWSLTFNCIIMQKI